MSKPEHWQRLYASRKAAGLCVRCGDPAEPSRSLCAWHRRQRGQYQRDLMKAARKALKAAKAREDYL